MNSAADDDAEGRGAEREPVAGDGPIRVEAVACLGCGCLCDDLVVTVASGRVIGVRRACERGDRWFAAASGRCEAPAATVDGQAVEPDVAVARAVDLLAGARSPLVLGLTGASVESQAAAVALADRIGAVIDPAHSTSAMPRLASLQRVGRVSATLGEVRNRADLVLFWGVDPVTTHPRHLERYSADPVGRFVPGGRAGRTLIVVAEGPNATAAVADQLVAVAPEKQLATLSTLRAIVRGARLAASRVEAATGQPLSELTALVERFRQAQYAAFFHGDALGAGPEGAACVEAAALFVRDLNALLGKRAVMLGLGGAGNPAGAEAVLAWQAGAPLACDFRRNAPRFLPGEATADAWLAGGLADLAVIVADDLTGRLSLEAAAHLSRIPTIQIGPDATDLRHHATVGLATGVAGVETGGSVMRCDGVSLPLRPALLGRGLASEKDWLDRLTAELPLRLSPA